jgi:uncharacterized protein
MVHSRRRAKSPYRTGRLWIERRCKFQKDAAVIDSPASSSTPAASGATELIGDFTAVITRLLVYPVKSCAGVELAEAILTDTGLEFDRAWMVVDAAGQFLTQRELPRMALIQPQLKHFEMVLRAPGMLALHISLNEVESPVRVSLWGEETSAYDMGNVAAQWFTDFLGQTARLVRFDPEEKRLSSKKWTGGLEAANQFSDGFPVLVISEASLAGFNWRMKAAGIAEIDMLRFRPNIVLGDAPGADGTETAAHDEDRIEDLSVQTEQGIAVLKPVKPCPRCPIPNIDPVTAISSPEVGDMLQSYRQDPRVNGAPTFGMNLIVTAGEDHLLKVGQRVAANYSFD